MKNWVLPFVLPIPTLSQAQTYSLDSCEGAGGGGTSTGRVYSVSGTMGPPDAGGAMSGGSYSVTSGFWASISVVPTAGMPSLTVAHSGHGPLRQALVRGHTQKTTGQASSLFEETLAGFCGAARTGR